jgi:hypothetical protein
MVAISRAELMEPVEKRVLREASRAVLRYYDDWRAAAGDGNFPPLAQYFDVPSAGAITTQFRNDLAVAVPAEGLLPVHSGHDLLDDTGAGQGLEGGFTLRWDITNTTPAAFPDVTTGTAYDATGGLISVKDSDVLRGPLASIPPSVSLFKVTVNQGLGYCVWDPDGGASRARCKMRPGQVFNYPAAHPRVGEELVPGDPMTTVISGTRTYSFDLDFVNLNYGGSDAASTITWPTLAPRAERTRDVDISTSATGQRLVVTVTDSVQIDDVLTPDPPIQVDSSKTATWTNASSSAGTRVEGIPYRMDTVRNLPEWFERNEWHHLVYVASSPSMQMGGGDDCSAAADSLQVHVGGVAAATTDLVLATLAMRDDLGATGTPADFLEGVNPNTAAAPRVVQRDAPSATFDDVLVAVRQRAPGPEFDPLWSANGVEPLW